MKSIQRGQAKAKREGPELDGNGEEDVSTSNMSTEKQLEESSQLLDVLPEHLVRYHSFLMITSPRRKFQGVAKDVDVVAEGVVVVTSSTITISITITTVATAVVVIIMSELRQINQPIKPEQHQQLPIGATKQPPGPRMPDGTRGFTMGRGKPQTALPGLCAVGEP
ncbi:hypothetical protein PR202_ga27869 [Eleusine coracana subsp. coracana]|uniref:Uncharacterized protein n=1 Tax=Eleusine coracana subsp. coracana TaxID=191504 RepID=A0AAV5DI03_ELECO|nr:hypothetical protein PR202_ga27869 [Eleusine coracana subsp. coracana]